MPPKSPSSSRAITRTGSGLKLRQATDGSIRPRWEPWPKARACGIKGRDLRDDAGQWLTRGAAVDAADARALWARAIIAAQTDMAARADLALALANLAAPLTLEAHQRRALLSDLLDVAQALCGAAGPIMATRATNDPAPWRAFATPADVPGPLRTVAALFDLYCRAADGLPSKSASTQKTYDLILRNGLKDPALAGQHVTYFDHARTSALVQSWAAGNTPAMLRLRLAVLAACWKWAYKKGWAGESHWTKFSPAAPTGRVVTWPLEQTRAFVSWADFYGFADVGDTITFLMWTGQRPGDLSRAKLSALGGKVWRLKQQKTGATAIVSLETPALVERLAAHRARRATMNVRPAHDHFITHPSAGTTFDANGLRNRFLAAVKTAQRQDNAKWAWLSDVRLQDLRDTCVTLLRGAGISSARVAAWTGHSEADCESIWRAHYVQALDQTAIDTGGELVAFAARLEANQ